MFLRHLIEVKCHYNFARIFRNLILKRMRDGAKEYEVVVKVAELFVKSVAEGNSEHAKRPFSDNAVLFGILNGAMEYGFIGQFYTNVDTVGADANFKLV